MAKHPGGRPRRNTPEMVDKTIDDMIRDYEQTKDVQMLDDTELMWRLNISPGTLERYYQGRADKALQDEEDAAAELTGEIKQDNISGEREYSTKQRYAEAMKKLIAYRRRICIANLTQDRFNSGWIFLSKQPHWGGFQDVQRQEKSGVQEFKITLSGPDGKKIGE